MKKILGIIFLSFLLNNVSSAKILVFECTAVKNNSVFEKNERLFETKKGTYITIQKKKNSDLNYYISQITGNNSENFFKYEKFRKRDRQRLYPYKQDVLKDFGVADWMNLPFVSWGPNKTENGFVLLESFEKLSTVNYYIAKGHECRENTNIKISKKEFKKIKKKSKQISAFELISNLSEHVDTLPKDIVKRIIDKENEINQKFKKADGIDHSFTFKDKSGQKITRNSSDGLWNKFWGAVGWVLYEHGDEILNLAVDLKYGTSQETQAGKMYCTSQRVGNSKIVHTTCRQR